MTHHTQAVMALGMMPDPMTGETSANKDAAKFHIDMLSVIEEKTKGNLTEEESEALNSILHQLQNGLFRFLIPIRKRDLGNVCHGRS